MSVQSAVVDASKQELTLEQKFAQVVALAQNLESVNKEAKNIADGLMQRCATLACERDNAVRERDSFKERASYWEAAAGGLQKMIDAINEKRAAEVAARNAEPTPAVVEESVPVSAVA